MAGSGVARRKKRDFIDALARTGNVSEAARRAGLSRSRAYQLRRADRAFAGEWEEAIEVAVDRLEAEARHRAVEGIEQPHFHQGRVCGTVRKYSDALLMFLLRAHRPHTYRERSDGGPADFERHLAEARDRLRSRLGALDQDDEPA